MTVVRDISSIESGFTMSEMSIPQWSYLYRTLSSFTPRRSGSRSLTQFRPMSCMVSIPPECLASADLKSQPFQVKVVITGLVCRHSEPCIIHEIELEGKANNEALKLSLSTLLDETLESAIEKSELMIDAEQTWNLKISVHILLKDDSSPVTAMSLAVRLAMLKVRLPVTIPKDLKVATGAGVDAAEGKCIVSAADLPLLMMVSLVGANVMFDASHEEAFIVTGRYIISEKEFSQALPLITRFEVAQPFGRICPSAYQREVFEGETFEALRQSKAISASIFRQIKSSNEERTAMVFIS